jgi:putative ABC transport system permease protein
MLGIGLGLLLGIIHGINVIADIKTDTPDIQLIIPWTTLILIAVGGYVFSLVTTMLPARQASRIAPAEALRYE